MKKAMNIFVPVLAVLTLVMTGCLKEEPNSGDGQSQTANKISVAAFVMEDTSTRAAVTGTIMPDNSRFGFYGYKGEIIYSDVEPEIPAERRSAQNVEVKVETGGKIGTIVGYPIYWPITNFTAPADNMKLFAYYPYQSSFDGTDKITSLGSTSSGLTIGWKTPSAADVDLMYAVSPTYTAIPTTDALKGKVPLTFKHKLSYFKVQAKLVDKTAATNSPTLIVTQASLKHNSEGTYTGSSDGWTATGAPITSTKSSLNVQLARVGVTKESELKDVAEFLVIPQTGTDREVVLAYTLNGNKTVTVPYNKLPPFELGKINILTVTFNVSDTAVAISFGIAVEEWGDGDDTDVEENIKI